MRGIPARRWRSGITVRTRLLIAVLVPLILLSALVAQLVADRMGTVRATEQLRARTTVLTQLAILRTRVFEERRQYETVAQAAAYGVDAELVSELLGMAVETLPARVRASTDDALRPLKASDQPFTDETLAELRASLDASTISISDAGEAFDSLEAATVASLSTLLGDVRGRAVEIGDVDLEAAVRSMGDAIEIAGLRGSQLRALSERWFASEEEAVASLARLAHKSEEYQQVSLQVRTSPIEILRVAWSEASDDGAVFDAAVGHQLGGTALAPEAPDLSTAGTILGDGLRHYDNLSRLPEVAASAVTDAALLRGAVARSSAQRAGVGALGGVIFALGTAMLFGRSITRPLHLLTEQVRRVGEGQLTLPPLPLSGPPELAVASSAFNDVTANLDLLERKAQALSECDFSREELSQPLPGRLGEALNASLEVLSESIMERQLLQSRLLHQATHDSLTGLANRRAVIEGLTGAVARSQRSGHPLAVTFIDLDDFKTTNDTCGHAIGDALLQAVAQRMEGASRGGDLVARLGGDEFVVVAEDVSGAHEALQLARRLLEAIAVPIEVGGRQFNLSASAGVAVSHDRNDDPLALLARADLAVYRSKQQPTTSSIELYDEELQQLVRERTELHSALARTLAAGGAELELHYQPILETSTGHVASLEALLRWDRPDAGPVPPDLFIPVAETSDLIMTLDRWVLDKATRQLAEWTDHPFLGRVTLAINVSGRHITDPSFVSNVAEALQRSGVDPERLILEVTETALVRDLSRAAAQLDAVRALGVGVAVDDFGTGHTGLTHIRALTIDEIKIDRSFTAELPTMTNLVQIVIDLARHLGVSTVAEGVETDQQARTLGLLGCTRLQGYLFCPALPPRDLEDWVAAHSGSPPSAYPETTSAVR